MFSNLKKFSSLCRELNVDGRLTHQRPSMQKVTVNTKQRATHYYIYRNCTFIIFSPFCYLLLTEIVRSTTFYYSMQTHIPEGDVSWFSLCLKFIVNTYTYIQFYITLLLVKHLFPPRFFTVMRMMMRHDFILTSVDTK